MKHLDLFSGIGGVSLACDWLDIETICFCEIDKFCQKVLKKHWPDVEIVEDVNNVEEIKRIVANTEGARIPSQTNRGQECKPDNGREIRDRNRTSDRILLTAGFPCQPFSQAGRRKGSADDRYFWPQTLAVIEAVKPDWVLLENVAGILSMVFPDSAVGVASQASLFNTPNDEIADYDTICGGIERDLRQAGYETVWLVIPACSVGAPHRRDRVWIIANRLGHIGQSSLPQQEQWGMANQDKQEAGVNSQRLINDTLGNKHRGGRGQSRGTDSLQGEHRPAVCSGGISRTGEDVADATQELRDRCGNTRPAGRRESANQDSDASDTTEQGLQRSISEGSISRGCLTECNSITGWQENWYEVATRFCRVDDEFPHRLDRNRVNRLKALGNAIVPAVAFEIIKAIVETESVLPL